MVRLYIVKIVKLWIFKKSHCPNSKTVKGEERVIVKLLNYCQNSQFEIKNQLSLG